MNSLNINKYLYLYLSFIIWYEKWFFI